MDIQDHAATYVVRPEGDGYRCAEVSAGDLIGQFYDLDEPHSAFAPTAAGALELLICPPATETAS